MKFRAVYVCVYHSIHWSPGDLSMVFGHRILQYTKALCQGHYDYLQRLSDALLFRIINYLELEDVGQLARASRRFRQVSFIILYLCK